MTATAPRKPRPRPARMVRLHVHPTGSGTGLIELTVGKDAAEYFLTELPADFGRGFQLDKIGGPATYAVHLDGAEKRCECMGFLHRGRCKHADGLAALIAAGKL